MYSSPLIVVDKVTETGSVNDGQLESDIVLDDLCQGSKLNP